MIYLFRSCSMVCDSCNMICDSCFRSLEGCSCCVRPCAGYLHLAVIFGLIIIWQATQGLSTATGRDLNIEIVGMGLVVGHVLSAIYLQHQLAKSLEQQQQHAGGTNAELLQRIRQLFLYDIGFCFYMLVFAFSFGFGCWGILNAPCKVPGVQSVCTCLILFGIFASIYVLIWICLVSCCGLTDRMFHFLTSSSRRVATTGTVMNYGTPAPGPAVGSQLTKAPPCVPAMVAAPTIPPYAQAIATPVPSANQAMAAPMPVFGGASFVPQS